MAITLPDGLWVHAGTLSVIRKEIREYMALDVAPVSYESGIETLTQAAHAGFPGTFDGFFPARVVQSSGARGRHVREHGKPEFLTFSLQVYDSLGRTDDEVVDRITSAEDACWDAYAEWLLAFDEDTGLQDRFRSTEIPSVEAGSSNRLGRGFVDLRSHERLWRLQAEVRLKL